MYPAVDIVELIAKVEIHPVLWDRTIPGYKCKHENAFAWEKISTELNEEFEDYSTVLKSEFVKYLIKKWNNTRDNFIRYCRKSKEGYFGHKPPKPYRYYNQLIFLRKTITEPESESETSTAHDEENSNFFEPCKPIKFENEEEEEGTPCKRKKVEDQDNEECDTVNSTINNQTRKDGHENHSRVMYFFKGIAPTIETFNDNDMVEFQYEVLKTVRNITTRRTQLAQASSSTSDQQTEK